MDLVNDLKRLCIVALLITLTACDRDGIFTGSPRPQETVVVLNSIDLSLTVFPSEFRGLTTTVGLGPAGTPVQAAVRDSLAVVPMGTVSAAVVVNLTTDGVRSIPLPANSGATGVGFLSDSIAYVTNPNLNTVSRLNLRRNTLTAQLPATVYPQAVVTVADEVWVLNAELDISFQPAGAGRITVIDDATLSVTDTIELTGFNPAAGTIGPGGQVYIINSGTFGQADGSLSVVDPSTLEEVEHHDGFGEFPGALEFGPDGYLYVTSFSYGVAVWDPLTASFISSPDEPLDLDGATSVSDVGFDESGRLYGVVPGDCISPGQVVRLEADLTSDRSIPVGVCPIAVLFTNVAR